MLKVGDFFYLNYGGDDEDIGLVRDVNRTGGTKIYWQRYKTPNNYYYSQKDVKEWITDHDLRILK